MNFYVRPYHFPKAKLQFSVPRNITSVQSKKYQNIDECSPSKNVLKNSIKTRTFDKSDVTIEGLLHLLPPPFIGNGVLMKMDEAYSLVYKNGSSTICSASFRFVLNKGLLEITFLQYALVPISGAIFAGVVCGASLTYCKIVRNGVIRK